MVYRHIRLNFLKIWKKIIVIVNFLTLLVVETWCVCLNWLRPGFIQSSSKVKWWRHVVRAISYNEEIAIVDWWRWPSAYLLMPYWFRNDSFILIFFSNVITEPLVRLGRWIKIFYTNRNICIPCSFALINSIILYHTNYLVPFPSSISTM